MSSCHPRTDHAGMKKLFTRKPIGIGNDSASLDFPLGLSVTYYDRGRWGTVYLGRRLRIGWSFKRPECREVYVTVNSTPWGVPRRLGRVLYVGRVRGKWSVFPNAEAYARQRHHRSYAEMRQWV